MKNKKTCLLLLASSALLLTGCGDSTTGAVPAPKGGTDTTLSKKAEKLAKAAGGTLESDDFSATIGVPSFSAKATSSSGSSEFNVSNAKATLAVSGYTKTAADFKASLNLSLDSLNAKGSASTIASGAVALAGVTAASSIDVSLGKAAFNAYVSEKNAYLDMSNANLYSAIASNVGSAANMSASDVEKVLPKKTVIANAVSDKAIPLFSAEQLSGIKTTLAGYAASIAQYADKLDQYFTVKDNSDGSTVIWTKLDLQTIAAISLAFDSSSESVDSSAALSKMISEAGNSKFDVTAELKFDENHILAAYLYEDVTVEANVGNPMNNQTLTIVSKGRLNVDLAYGDKATVTLPSDLDTYVASPLLSTFFA